MRNIKTNRNIQSAYNDQYDDHDGPLTKWRDLAGKYKSQNIIKVVNGRSFQKILDFGSGTGSILEYLDGNAQFGQFSAIEISNNAIAQLKKKKLNLKEVKEFDGYDTGYSDNEFDLALCMHVIEHVEYPRLVLREIGRISKYQVFEIPLDYIINVDKKLKTFLKFGHISIYTPSLFRYLLKSEGFIIENEIYSPSNKETLEFSWYQHRNLDRTLKTKLLIHLHTNQGKIARLLFGKAISNEFFHSTYTCLTSKSEELNIF